MSKKIYTKQEKDNQFDKALKETNKLLDMIPIEENSEFVMLLYGNADAEEISTVTGGTEHSMANTLLVLMSERKEFADAMVYASMEFVKLKMIEKDEELEKVNELINRVETNPRNIN